MTGLSPRESACLGFITMFDGLYGRAPSYGQIADCFGMASRNTAVRLVAKLHRTSSLKAKALP